jgi:putative colanic acid biosynthesis acetyltransferase WcaF
LTELDVTKNRAAAKWTAREQLGRVLWAAAWPLFRLSPRPFWVFRRALLRLFGATVGAGVHVYPTVRIAIPWNIKLGHNCAVGDRVILYSLGLISIGNRSTISQGVHLCAGTHNIADLARQLLKPPIFVGDDAWVCADAFIGPGVTVANGVIVGARAVVMRDVTRSVIVAGNPAREIRSIT